MMKFLKKKSVLVVLAAVVFFGLVGSLGHKEPVANKPITLAERLKDYQPLVGKKEVSYQDLKFSINPKLNLSNGALYPVSKLKTYPKMIVYNTKKDVDYTEKDITEVKKLGNQYITGLIGNNASISNEKETTREHNVVLMTYDITLSKIKSKDKVYSKYIKYESAFIPSHTGLYIVTLGHYKSDKNNYRFDQLVESIDIDALQTKTLEKKNEKIKKKQLKELKNQVDKISIVNGANEQETQIFNTRKQQVYDLIKNNASVDEVNAAIAGLNQTNTDIQNRIDAENAAKEAAAQEAQRQEALRAQSNQVTNVAPNTGGIQGGYYCVDGTYVGNANPHARGRANACYGHGGFAINH